VQDSRVQTLAEDHVWWQNKKRRSAKSRAALEDEYEYETALARDDGHATVRLVVLNDAILQSKKRPVTTDSDVLAWMQLGAALPHDDGAGED